MSASVGRPAEDARPPFMSQVHTWGDASLLALLLAADFTWLIADKEVNQVSLPLALVWASMMTYQLLTMSSAKSVTSAEAKSLKLQ